MRTVSHAQIEGYSLENIFQNRIPELQFFSWMELELQFNYTTIFF